MKIKAKDLRARTIAVEVDALQFERLAATFGFFSPDFLKSLKRAEKDYKAGKISKIQSLKDLRK